MLAGTDLTTKALLALEEACHAARYIQPERTYALRFALAYLYALKGGDPAPYRRYWSELASDNNVFRHQNVNRELDEIYRRAKVERDDKTMFAMWRVAQDRHGPDPAGDRRP
ncbi:hypothetical protein JMG10_34275 [Nostoc ellipsosporum NOK]|nr:hypothetical protein [Nostoc ellipsosporum NOK]